MRPRCTATRYPVLVLALAVVAAGAARADTVVTTSGQTFHGHVVEETPEKVVIQTRSGTVTIPASAVARVLRSGGGGRPEIVAETIRPSDAPKALEEAKAALARKDWTKAGGVYEGLLQLPLAAFPAPERLAVTAPLVTCYLGVRDARGAVRTLRRRADLVTMPSDKDRLLAAADALDKAGGPAIDGKPVATYEEALEAAMAHKAARLLEEARDLAAKATALNETPKLEAAAKRALDKLGEADLYVPGSAAAHRREVLVALADNIMQAARSTVAALTDERRSLSQMHPNIPPDAKGALFWNTLVGRYLARRQAAEDGLKNLRAFAPRHQAPDLYAEREKEAAELLARLDDLGYHQVGPGIPERARIQPRQIGSPFGNR